MSTKTDHLNYLKQCLNLAKSSVGKGNHPFGAIIVLNGEIITSSENEVVSLNDVTAHAELLLIQKAQKVMTESELKQSTLYTSTEPCAMCSGAIYWSGIGNVVFGCSNKILCEVVGGSLEISCEEVFEKGNKTITVKGFSSLKSFSDIHKGFWNKTNKVQS